MKLNLKPLLVWIVVLACAGATHADGEDHSGYTAEEVGDGVHLLRPADARMARTNSVVVERNDGLLVIEAQPSPEAARELLAAVGRISDAPVRYLVVSHPHTESTGGASAFPEETLVIATRGSWHALSEAEGLGAEVRQLSDDPSAWTEPPRRLPVLVLMSTTVLEDPRNAVEVMPSRHAHSRGDLLVRLKGGKIVYAGAVLFPERTPYTGDANMNGWIDLLNDLIVEGPDLLLPLHGPVQTSRTIRHQRDGFAFIRGQVEYGFVERETPEQIPQFVYDNERLASYFAERDAFLEMLIQKVVDDTIRVRKKRGLM